MQSKHAMALALVALTFGSAFLFIRVLVDAGMGAFGVSAARTGVGVLVLSPVMYWQRDKFPRDRRVILALGGIGLINMALPFTFFPLAEQRVSSGTASIMNASMPMITAVLAALLIADERFTRTRVAGLALGFLGVLALMGGDVGAENATGTVVGILFLLGAVLGYSTAGVFIRKWHKPVSAVPLTYIQLLFASAVTVPLAFATGAYSGTSMGLEEWGSLFALTVSGTALAVLLYMWLVVELGPVRASVVTYLFPPIGVFLGWLLLDEPVGWTLLVSLVLVVAGVALVQASDVLKRLLPTPLRPRETVTAPGD
jgi:drug/metabolite transporter (DMT)-like permease